MYWHFCICMYCQSASHLSFPHSSLELEVVPVRHLSGNPNFLVCAQRIETRGARIDL